MNLVNICTIIISKINRRYISEKIITFGNIYGLYWLLNKDMEEVSMKRKGLLEYVKKVACLESAIFTQNKLLMQLDNEIANASNVQLDDFYTKKTFREEKPKEYEKQSVSDIVIIAIIIWVFISLPVILICTNKENPNGAQIPFFSETIIIIVISGILIFFRRAQEREEYNNYVRSVQWNNDENRKKINDYNKRVDEANRNINDANYQKKEKAAKQVEMLKLYKDKLINIKNETQKTLIEFYSKNIIFPKYQNIIAVTSFNDYLQSGVCDDLEGYEGCYNKFDVEIRLDTIINKMDDVIDNLERIRNNQHTLYVEIQKCNDKLDLLYTSMQEMTNNITGGLEEVKASTIAAISNNDSSNLMLEYYAQENARNIADIKWINTMNYLDNGGWTL